MPSPAVTPPQVLPFAYPLDEFYALAGRTLPLIETVSGDEVPEPYRQLLVHERDMTPTLEAFHGETLHLKVLGRELRDETYFREVLLVGDRTGNAVEFGAIKINLGLFPPAARRQILEELYPLGHILQELSVVHSSRPKAFLRIQADDFILNAFGLTGSHGLYGRRNTLADPQQRPLAEIVEILPPERGSVTRGA